MQRQVKSHVNLVLYFYTAYFKTHIRTRELKYCMEAADEEAQWVKSISPKLTTGPQSLGPTC